MNVSPFDKAVEHMFDENCEACGAEDEAGNLICEGCGCCQQCCNCTDTDCDCEACEDRRKGEE